MSVKLGRRRAEQWLHPLRRVLREIKAAGTVREAEGHAIMEFEGTLTRVDFCFDGFSRLIKRVLPNSETATISVVFQKIVAFDGVRELDINLAIRELNAIEAALARVSCDEIKDAARTLEISARMSMEDAT